MSERPVWAGLAHRYSDQTPLMSERAVWAGFTHRWIGVVDGGSAGVEDAE